MFEPHWKFPLAPCFKFKEFIPSAISSSGNTCDIKLPIAEVVFVSVSCKSYLLGFSAPGLSSFLIWLCGPWLLIKVSLHRE